MDMWSFLDCNDTLTPQYFFFIPSFSLSSLSAVWKAQCNLLQTMYVNTKQKLKGDMITLFNFLALYQCRIQLLCLYRFLIQLERISSPLICGLLWGEGLEWALG